MCLAMQWQAMRVFNCIRVFSHWRQSLPKLLVGDFASFIHSFIHFISFRFISFHFIHFISFFHFIPFHSFHFISFISFHFIHFISFHFISFISFCSFRSFPWFRPFHPFRPFSPFHSFHFFIHVIHFNHFNHVNHSLIISFILSFILSFIHFISFNSFIHSFVFAECSKATKTNFTKRWNIKDSIEKKHMSCLLSSNQECPRVGVSSHPCMWFFSAADPAVKVSAVSVEGMSIDHARHGDVSDRDQFAMVTFLAGVPRWYICMYMLTKQFRPTSLQTFANMLCDVLLFLLLRAMPVAASTSNMNNGSRKCMESPWITMNSTTKSTRQEWSNATTISAKLDHHIGGSIFLEPISPHDGMIIYHCTEPQITARFSKVPRICTIADPANSKMSSPGRNPRKFFAPG